MHIRKKQDCHAFDSKTGLIVYELAGRSTGGALQHSLAHIEILPGGASLKHYHPVVEESYYILKGEAKIEINGEFQYLKTGQMVVVPPKLTHQIFNESDTLLQFLAVCSPPWTTDCSVYEKANSTY